MSKTYTKTGDNGTTQLADGTFIPKHFDRITACGHIDELNAFLGLAKNYISPKSFVHKSIESCQEVLLKINAKIALASTPEIITMDLVRELEQEIDEMNSSLPPLQDFVIPGANKASAYLHVARTVCRRAETK